MAFTLFVSVKTPSLFNNNDIQELIDNRKENEEKQGNSSQILLASLGLSPLPNVASETKYHTFAGFYIF